MNKVQLDNLIRFSILFRMEGISNSSPDYIQEKFLSFFGNVSYKEVDIPITEDMKLWASKWRFEDMGKIKNILLFINTINSYRHLDITSIKDTYDNFFHNILNKCEVKLHASVELKISSWLESVVINRDYKINLVTGNR